MYLYENWEQSQEDNIQQSTVGHIQEQKSFGNIGYGFFWYITITAPFYQHKLIFFIFKQEAYSSDMYSTKYTFVAYKNSHTMPRETDTPEKWSYLFCITWEETTSQSKRHLQAKFFPLQKCHIFLSFWLQVKLAKDM